MLSKSKYNNKKVIHNNIKFDSKMERDYYIYLIENKESLHIKDIELQPVFLLQEKFIHNGKIVRSIKYKADFKITYKDINFKCVRKVKNEWKVIM